MVANLKKLKLLRGNSDHRPHYRNRQVVREVIRWVSEFGYGRSTPPWLRSIRCRRGPQGRRCEARQISALADTVPIRPHDPRAFFALAPPGHRLDLRGTAFHLMLGGHRRMTLGASPNSEPIRFWLGPGAGATHRVEHRHRTTGPRDLGDLLKRFSAVPESRFGFSSMVMSSVGPRSQSTPARHQELRAYRQWRVGDALTRRELVLAVRRHNSPESSFLRMGRAQAALYDVLPSYLVPFRRGPGILAISGARTP